MKEATIPTETLAKSFSNVLNEWLTKEEMATVIERNQTPEYQDGSCATHDFCDANQAIIDAFEKEAGRELDTQDEDDMKLIQKAWDLARDNNFYTA